MQNNEFLDYSGFFPVDGLKAGFTIYSWPHSIETSVPVLSEFLGLTSNEVVIPSQKHTNNVTICKKKGILDKTDGIVTANKNIILTIRVADCIPFFIVDVNRKYHGLVHAGWRGVVNGIIPEAISKMESLGSNLNDIYVFAGPSIHSCCFEIGPEVARHFTGDFLSRGKGDRSYLDLVGSAMNQFTSHGIVTTHTKIFNECTKCSGKKYHSFRRDGDDSGRMIAMLGWK